jgi:hypothetical protein
MPWWWGYTETVSPSPPRLHRISTQTAIDHPASDRKPGLRKCDGLSRSMPSLIWGEPMRRRDFVMLLGAAVPCPLKAHHSRLSSRGASVYCTDWRGRPCARLGRRPRLPSARLHCPPFFALIYCLHAVLRALTAGQGALCLAGAYAGITSQFDPQRKSRLLTSCRCHVAKLFGSDRSRKQVRSNRGDG